jgi:GT2 family glycosyltransferase
MVTNAPRDEPSACRTPYTVRSVMSNSSTETLVAFPTVFTVVLNWRDADATIACVESLLAQTYASISIVVVDNGSEDGSIDRLTQALPGVPVLDTGANLGYAGGNNIGIRYALEAGADIVWILNNDTLVAPDCLSHLIATLDGSTSVVVPTIFFGSRGGVVQYAGGDIDLWRGRTRNWGWGDTTIPNSERPPTFASGCSLLIPRAVLERVGSLDESYFMYWEDVDYSLRLRRAEIEIRVASKAHVWHALGAGSGSIGGLSVISCYYKARNRLWLLRRELSGVKRFLALAYTIPWFLRLLKSIAQTPRGKKQFFIASLRGIAAGLRGRPYPAEPLGSGVGGVD